MYLSSKRANDGKTCLYVAYFAAILDNLRFIDTIVEMLGVLRFYHSILKEWNVKITQASNGYIRV